MAGIYQNRAVRAPLEPFKLQPSLVAKEVERVIYFSFFVVVTRVPKR